MTTLTFAWRGATLVQIIDEHGEHVLYDIYVNGRWIGSRRTIRQVNEALT